MRALGLRRLLLFASLYAPLGFAADVVLNGAGATFPEPLYTKWFATYRGRAAGLEVRYSAVGSGAGVDQLRSGSVDFAASDVRLTADQTAAFGTPVLEIPSSAGAVVPAYNIPGVGSDLRFTPDVLAAIYLGTIKKWNAPEIAAINRGVRLPNEPIVPVHRRDASGTTYIWTDFLANTNAEWKNRLGRGTSVAWPMGTGADQNAGVIEFVQANPYSIGYVEWIYAIRNRVGFGAVRNSSGKFVVPSLEAITAGVSSPTSAMAYPISSYTYLIVPKAAKDPAKGAALRELLTWALTSGQNQAAGLGYVALPASVAAEAAKAVQALR